MKRAIPILLVLICIASFGPSSQAQHVLNSSRRNPTIDAVFGEISPSRIEANVRKLVSFGTRHTLSDPADPKRGIGAARKWIKTEFDAYAKDSGGRLKVEEDSFLQPVAPRVPSPTTLVNIVATLPGDDPVSRDRWIVISGHYDSIPRPLSDTKADAPGANDDASGTAVVMELARALSKQHFDATLVFMAVAGEEQGLLGATHWAEQAKADGRRIEAMLTNDIVGNTLGGNGVRDNRRLRVFSEGIPSNESEAQARVRGSIGGENDGISRQLARYLKDVAEHDMPDFEVSLIFRRDRYGRGGDHIPFNERGFAAVRLTEPNEDFNRQHERVEIREGISYGDNIEYVDFDFVARVARVNASLMVNLALAPAPPADVRFGSARQSYDTTLSWKRGPDADLAGYRVLWRSTEQPYWQRSREVGDVSEVVLNGLSKDDLFFAVQAIDKTGNASLPVVPSPAARPNTPARP